MYNFICTICGSYRPKVLIHIGLSLVTIFQIDEANYYFCYKTSVFFVSICVICYHVIFKSKNPCLILNQ